MFYHYATQATRMMIRTMMLIWHSSKSVEFIIYFVSQEYRPITPHACPQLHPTPYLLLSPRTKYFVATSLHCVSKNDTDVAHYNFNTYHPILVIFGGDVAERVCYRTVISYQTFPNYCLCTNWGKMSTENSAFSVIPCLENDTALTCYIFDNDHPILIILGS